MEQMKAQAEHVGTEIVSDVITSVDLDLRPFRLTGDSGETYTCDALIIATGAQAKWLGLPSEQKFQGFGVSACATCDGFFYRDREVMVVGGGNTAVEEALFLTNFARKVTVVHRRDEFRAERILQDRLFKNPKVEVLWNTEVAEVRGKPTPPSVNRRCAARHHDRRHLRSVPPTACSSPSATRPSTAICSRASCHMKRGGYLITEPDSTATAIPGVFAAGDVTDDIYRQAVTAAGMGCMAALEAERFLAAHELAEAAE